MAIEPKNMLHNQPEATKQDAIYAVMYYLDLAVQVADVQDTIDVTEYLGIKGLREAAKTLLGMNL